MQVSSGPLSCKKFEGKSIVCPTVSRTLCKNILGFGPIRYYLKVVHVIISQPEARPNMSSYVVFAYSRVDSMSTSIPQMQDTIRTIDAGETYDP